MLWLQGTHHTKAPVKDTQSNGKCTMVSNDTLHNDLGIPIISDVIKERSNKHHNRLERHQSIDAAATRGTKLQAVKKTAPN
jgi:hypothetical protein